MPSEGSHRQYFEDHDPDTFIYLDGKPDRRGYAGIGEQSTGKSTFEQPELKQEALSEDEQQRLQTISEQIAQGIVPPVSESEARLLGLATTAEIKKRLSQDDLGKGVVNISKDGAVLSINLYKEKVHDKGHLRYTYEATMDKIAQDEQLKETIYNKCEEKILSGEEGWQFLSKNLVILSALGIIEKLGQSKEVKQAIAAGIVRDLAKEETSLSLHGDDCIFLHFEEPGLNEILGSTEVRYSDEVRKAWRDYIVAMFKKDMEKNTDEAMISIQHHAAYFGYNSVAGDPEIRNVAKEYFRVMPKKGDYYSTPCKALLIEDLREESLKAA